MEIYTIGLSNGWCISHENIDDFGDYEIPKFINELNFAQLEVKDGKIIWIFDPFPIKDEVIKKCQNLAMFENTAEFRVSEFDGKKWVFKETFKGSFINALLYIKENFSF